MTSPDTSPDLPCDGPDAEAEIRRRVASLDLDSKARLLTGASFWTLPACPGIGLRSVVTSDGPAGVRGVLWDERSTSVNVPSPTSLAATWDPSRAYRTGELLAAECRRKEVDVLLAPTVNLHRTPYGGRHFECFSEDPLLTSAMGAAFVRGLQEQGVAATVKHVVGNDSETQRYTYDARIAERPLRELYLAPFEAVLRAGAWAAMAAYNGVNGATMTESPMLTAVLKGEWGFDGVIVSDWGANRSTEASAAAGLDLVMPGPDGCWGPALADAVRAGRIGEDVLDDKLARVLRLAARVGALAGFAPATPPAAAWSDERAAAEVRAAAADGMVLLRNEPPSPGAAPLLPLPAGVRRIAVVGPNAAHLRTLGGGSATVCPPYVVDVPDGLAAALGPEAEILVAPGVRAYTRMPVAAPGLLRLPGGEHARQGAEVRCLDASGAVLGREVRHDAFLNWHDTIAGVRVRDVRTVEIETVVRAPAAGTYEIGASGLGRFELLVRGERAFDEVLSLPDGVDPVESLSRPPQRGVRVELGGGDLLPVTLRHRLDIAPDALNPTLSLQLNVAEPAVPDDDATAAAAALAASCDAAVVVVGTTEEVESEGYDRDGLALPGRQDDLVRAVVAANPRTAVVVNAGAPVLLPWRDEVPAVLMAWFPGQEGGHAIADVLLGRREPGGRLPVGWPASEDGLPPVRPVDGVLDYAEGLYVGHRAAGRPGYAPAFGFGHGLGYTTWEYRGVEVTGPGDGGGLEVSVRVGNTGERPGKEVVQVYASRPDSLLERPARWLAGFAAVTAGPGEEVVARVEVPVQAFRHWDPAIGTWAVEPGRITLSAGPDVGGVTAVVTVPGLAETGASRPAGGA